MRVVWVCLVFVVYWLGGFMVCGLVVGSGFGGLLMIVVWWDMIFDGRIWECVWDLVLVSFNVVCVGKGSYGRVCWYGWVIIGMLYRKEFYVSGGWGCVDLIVGFFCNFGRWVFLLMLSSVCVGKVVRESVCGFYGIWEIWVEEK